MAELGRGALADWTGFIIARRQGHRMPPVGPRISSRSIRRPLKKSKNKTPSLASQRQGIEDFGRQQAVAKRGVAYGEGNEKGSADALNSHARQDACQEIGQRAQHPQLHQDLADVGLSHLTVKPCRVRLSGHPSQWNDWALS